MKPPEKRRSKSANPFSIFKEKGEAAALAFIFMIIVIAALVWLIFGAFPTV